MFGDTGLGQRAHWVVHHPPSSSEGRMSKRYFEGGDRIIHENRCLSHTCSSHSGACILPLIRSPFSAALANNAENMHEKPYWSSLFRIHAFARPSRATAIFCQHLCLLRAIAISVPSSARGPCIGCSNTNALHRRKKPIRLRDNNRVLRCAIIGSRKVHMIRFRN